MSMKLVYQSPEAFVEESFPEASFLQAASGRIQDYQEIPDTWN